MEKEFVPFNLAVKLKELGFDEDCVMSFSHSARTGKNRLVYSHIVIENYMPAPLWRQAFDWCFKKFNCNCKLSIGTLFITIEFTIKNKSYKISELTKQACLEKLIELLENETIQN